VPFTLASIKKKQPIGFEAVHQPKSRCPLPSVKFRVNPWQMLLLGSVLPSVFFRVFPWLCFCLCLISVANSASASVFFRVIPWQCFCYRLFLFPCSTSASFRVIPCNSVAMLLLSLVLISVFYFCFLPCNSVANASASASASAALFPWQCFFFSSRRLCQIPVCGDPLLVVNLTFTFQIKNYYDCEYRDIRRYKLILYCLIVDCDYFVLYC